MLSDTLVSSLGPRTGPGRREESRRGKHECPRHKPRTNSTILEALVDPNMKDTYDFSKGKQGRVVAEPPPEPGRVRITIRLDEDLVDYFGAIADQSGGRVGYQTLINSALREYVEGKTRRPNS